MTQATTEEQRAFTPHSPARVATGTPTVPDNLELFAGGFFEGAGPSLTTVLNRKVTVRVTGIRAMSSAELVAATPLPWVIVEATYQRGLAGTHWIVLPVKSALALGRAVTGDEDDDSEILPGHQEVIRNTINQILVSTGPTLMPLFARSISFIPVTVHVVEDVDALPREVGAKVERLWTVQAEASGDDGLHVDMILTIGEELAREISAIGTEETPGAAAPRDTRRVEAPAPSKIDLIMDVTLPVTVELGRARMQIQDVLKLSPGSVIELDKSAGDPVELFINERPIAKGEVVIIDENFGVRLTSIVTATERIKTLR